MTQSWGTTPTPPEQQAAAAEPAPTKPQARPAWLLPAGLVIVVLAAGAIGFFLGRSSIDSSASLDGAAAVAAEEAGRLKVVYETCSSRDPDNTVSLEDDGATIVIDTGSEYGDYSGVDCVLRELDTPASIEAQIGRTTAMMGVQDADNDGLHYSWSYHPDNGVNMVITEEG
ncbi:hypothetical protein ACI797_15350 [Geodermatophilus sp. SYSU D00691]